MKALLKNWLSPNNISLCFSNKNKMGFLLILFFSFKISNAQIANYVSNGGFEEIIDCNNPFPFKIKSWGNIDTTKAGFYALNTCYGNVPYAGLGRFQYPRHGSGFILGTVLCDVNNCNPNTNRNYFKNRLKSKLVSGVTYCVKFYVNNINVSAFGIDSYGAYFGDNSLDTINYTMKPLTYLTPQVQNPVGNIITDTLNWALITGTFVASGNEKYMVIGNFKNDASTMKSQIQPTVSYAWCDANFDDVSVIDVNLPANAGGDVWAIPSNTVYLGRPQDVGIDEACMWYHLPNITTAIDTAAGITITVAATTQTYMVKQDICGNIKYDTVIVYASATGFSEREKILNSFNIFPNPANNELTISCGIPAKITINHIIICNSIGQSIREEEIDFKNNKVSIKVDDLPNGLYILTLTQNNNNTQPLTISKRFVIVR